MGLPVEDLTYSMNLDLEAHGMWLVVLWLLKKLEVSCLIREFLYFLALLKRERHPFFFPSPHLHLFFIFGDLPFHPFWINYWDIFEKTYWGVMIIKISFTMIPVCLKLRYDLSSIMICANFLPNYPVCLWHYQSLLIFNCFPNYFVFAFLVKMKYCFCLGLVKNLT